MCLNLSSAPPTHAVSPLLDALGRNSSLVFLDLTKSGLTWTSAKATGRPLLENMANNKSALSGTRTLIISAASRYKIPLLKLRKGGEEAVAALRSTDSVELLNRNRCRTAPSARRGCPDVSPLQVRHSLPLG